MLSPQEVKFDITPHTINVWVPVKIQFFSLKQIYKLSILWRLWKIKSWTHSGCIPSGITGLLQSMRDLWIKVFGSGQQLGGDTLQPSWRGSHWETFLIRVVPRMWQMNEWMMGGTMVGLRRGLQESVLLPSQISLPSSLSTYQFGFLISKRTTVALLSPCWGLNGGKVWHTEHRFHRVRIDVSRQLSAYH